jgi:hypothetical protein
VLSNDLIMLRGLLLFIIFIVPVQLLAQTGIGTTNPHPSAKLEVASDKQGFLPPQVSLTSTTDITTIKNAAGTSITPATGLLVYCKGDAGLAAGYYFWNGNAWATIATAGGSGSFSASRTTSPVAYTTTASGSAFGWSFGSANDTIIYHFTDADNGRMYRVTLVIMPSYINNFISIERLL